MLANNYKVPCFHLQNASHYVDTANAPEAWDLVCKFQTQKYVFYRHLFMNLHISNKQVVCMLHPVLSWRKYCHSWRAAGSARRTFLQVVQSSYYWQIWCSNIYRSSIDINYLHKKSSKKCYSVLKIFYDNFNYLVGKTINYFKQQFVTFKEPPLCDFTIFFVKL